MYRLALADIDPALLWTAVLQHISNSKWLPTIAELRQRADEIILEEAGHLAAPEAWGLLLREVRRVGHWGAPDLPPNARQALDAIGGWRALCMSENSAADRARFLEAYNLICQRQADKRRQFPQQAAANNQQITANGQQITVDNQKLTENNPP